LNAQAFTVGNDIYFNSGKYAPESDSGRHLLAHELTHTVQQGGGVDRKIQRRLVVENPNSLTAGSTTIRNFEEVRSQIQNLSPNFSVNSSGETVANSTGSCTSPSEMRDECLCHFVNASNTWTIRVNNNEWPHTDPSTSTITVQNSFSNIEFGAWGGNGQVNQRIAQSHERVLGHELCGHAFLMEQGTHPTHDPRTSFRFGRPHHEPTVIVENQIADEIAGTNAPDRGVFSDPHQGESFGKITIANYISGESDLSSSPDASKINDAIAFLINDRDLKVDIVGHSDSIGNTDRISKNRARKIRSELISAGVRRRQIRNVVGFGNSECTSVGDDPSCRKVEIFMYIFRASGIR
jgi:outer membrane protein OmpA-like peptidoglycan-associated protein